ncbi:hypothetical protein OH77DRAFT_1002044 [Trametes cingulata]|nr:hypothetical protein OH77DRAFT_1002044 [Trametes cingulata]
MNDCELSLRGDHQASTVRRGGLPTLDIPLRTGSTEPRMPWLAGCNWIITSWRCCTRRCSKLTPACSGCV